MAVVCLVLVQPPREVTTQLTSPRVSAVVDVIFRWMLMLAVLLGIGYVTKSPLQVYPRRIFLTWAAITPAVLIVSTLAMQEVMRRFLMNAFDTRSAIVAGYNTSSLELCAPPAEQSRACASRWPASSMIAAPIGSAWNAMHKLLGPLARPWAAT